MSRYWTAPLAGLLLTSALGCSNTDPGTDRVTPASATVQLLSVETEQVVTPAGLTLTLIASVEPPVVADTQVQANSFWLDSSRVYIAYNNAGLPVVGAIDVVDLTIPAKPRLASQMAFATQKINGVAAYQGYLYYTGASGTTGGAVIGKIALGKNGELGAASAPEPLPSYAGTGLVARSTGFYATSGDAGGLAKFDANLDVSNALTLSDARGVAISPDGRTVGVVRGQPGTVNLFDASGTPVATFPLGGASIPESKSTIQMGNRLLLASLGEGGFALVCSQTGTILASEAAVAVADASVDSTVTNAVSAGAGLVFAANGAAGVYVYKLSQGPVIQGTNCTQDSLTLLGHMDLGAFSANMVYLRNNYLLVGDGLGGLRIISVSNTVEATDGGEHDFVHPGTGLVVLNPEADGALTLSGNARLSVVDGFVHVDSASNKALSASGNAQLSANATFVAGSSRLTGNATVSGALTNASAPLADPLAWLPVPNPSELAIAATAAVNVTDNGIATLNPGVYENGIALSGNAKATLNPGVYYIVEGGLSLSGNASLTGQGVLIYSASLHKGLTLSGNGTVWLSPVPSGTYAGITYFQNRASTAPTSISGNGFMSIVGALYMARAPLTLSGNGQLPTLGSLDVADTVSITGNGAVVLRQ